jgi:hypothetical protein
MDQKDRTKSKKESTNKKNPGGGRDFSLQSIQALEPNKLPIMGTGCSFSGVKATAALF